MLWVVTRAHNMRSLRTNVLFGLEAEITAVSERINLATGWRNILAEEPEYDPKELELIEDQLKHMRQYLNVLQQRHQHWKDKPET